jgi:hypothetical protein
MDYLFVKDYYKDYFLDAEPILKDSFLKKDEVNGYWYTYTPEGKERFPRFDKTEFYSLFAEGFIEPAILEPFNFSKDLDKEKMIYWVPKGRKVLDIISTRPYKKPL